MVFRVHRQSTGIVSILPALLVSAGFIGIGSYIFFTGVYINPSWTKVEGRVTNYSTSTSSDGAKTYSSTVKYVAGDSSFTVNSIGTSSFPTVGEMRQVAYDPSDPQRAKVVEDRGTSLLILMFPIIGVLILLHSFIALIRTRKRTRNIEHLKQTGQKVQGIITDVINQSSRSTHQQIVVTATAPDGKVQNYISDPLNTFAGLNLMTYREKPIAVDIYIDPAKHDHYYVDIEDIPQLTAEQVAALVLQSQAESAKPPNKP